MKALVNATGDIVDIIRNSAFDKDVFYDSNGQKYNREELSFDFREKSFPKDDDYWIHLEHQATIGAMQGILGNQTYTRHFLETSTSAKDARDIIVDVSYNLAHSLIEKLKEKEEMKLKKE